MGQYGNQPDFGTIAQTISPTGNPSSNDGISLKPSALYIASGGNLLVTVVGGNIDGINGATLFRNVPDGTFFPLIVTNVWASTSFGEFELSTTCSDIIAIR